MREEGGLMTLQEAAVACGTTYASLYGHSSTGALRVRREGRHLYVSAAALAAFRSLVRRRPHLSRRRLVDIAPVGVLASTGRHGRDAR
jgi:hypothetical protein